MTAKPDRRQFDGIICLGGEDWWYHNRGHFDFQIMRRLARTWPVLFVNSLGVRMPSLSDKGLFAARIGRKLKSLGRGVVHVENGFWVYSPVSVPGALGQTLTGFALAPQLRLAALRAGIRRPLLWLHCPAAASLAGKLGECAVVMQRTDRFEAFPEGDPVRLGAEIRSMKNAADLVVYAAPHLAASEARQVRRQLVVTHGVDLEAFVGAGSVGPGELEPVDMRPLPRPRVGFIGGIDAHTFDPALFLDVAGRLPEATFAMIGGSSLADGWCRHPNVHFMGRKPYDQIARYMAAADVLVMPWNRSSWIEACNPVKLKEYLAVGRPVVTIDFPALDGYRDLVQVANDAEGFVAAIRRVLATPFDPAPGRARIAAETWDAKAAEVAAAILDLGLAFAPAAQQSGFFAMPAQSPFR